jgi:hypothetical protein
MTGATGVWLVHRHVMEAGSRLNDSRVCSDSGFP